MSDFPFVHLSLAEDGFSFDLPDLPVLGTVFHIPTLQERPQDPIMDGLTLNQRLRTASHQSSLSAHKHIDIPVEVPALTLYHGHWLDTQSIDDWTTLCSLPSKPQDQCLSWDTMRTSSQAFTALAASPFLSEQSDFIVAAARHFVQPSYDDGDTVRLHISQSELLPSLKALAMGISTSLYRWHEGSRAFVLTSGKRNTPAKLVVDGVDETSINSLTENYVSLGTLLRRCEDVIENIRLHPGNEGAAPTFHAFSHGLTTVLVYIRRLIARVVVPPPSSNDGAQPLAAYWSSFILPLEIASAISTLTGCGMGVTESSTISAMANPTQLLSTIWQHLSSHVDKGASTAVIACLAHVLNVASRPYIDGLCETLGFLSQTSAPTSRMSLSTTLGDMQEMEGEEEYLFDGSPFSAQAFPDFVPSRLTEKLPRAQRSLRLLQAADPNHFLLRHPTQRPDVAWLWIPHEIEAAWNRTARPRDQVDWKLPAAPSPIESSITTAYKAELLDFQRFDLAPGNPNGMRGVLHMEDIDVLESLVSKFPVRLPMITPTLPSLAELVFDPITQQTDLLADSLLRIFLMETSTLYFPAHLALLRSFMLLTSPAFKDRVETALFSSEEEPHASLSGTLRRPGSRVSSAEGGTSTNVTWAVGLSRDLEESEAWPPSGSDFAYHLRTVINDSLPLTLAEVGDHRNRKIWHEAETKLGFALRELPTKTGKEGWLNPLSLEALDSVYLTYQAPHPLDVLISSDIVAKYQRVFTFLLRLTRVESVCRAIYRMTRSVSHPPFVTLARPRTMVNHFRFAAHAFVSALASYVYDSAIRSQLDAFLADVVRHASRRPHAGAARSAHFTDVFALADYHSAVLDDILFACLLRSGQRVAAVTMQRCLETILELGVLMGKLRLRQIEEYQAAPELEALWDTFCRQKSRLISTLKGMVEKDKFPVQALMLGASAGMPDRSTTGSAMLHDLLLRLGGGLVDDAHYVNL